MVKNSKLCALPSCRKRFFRSPMECNAKWKAHRYCSRRCGALSRRFGKTKQYPKRPAGKMAPYVLKLKRIQLAVKNLDWK